MKSKVYGIWCMDDGIGFWLMLEKGQQFHTKNIDEALDAYNALKESGAIGIEIRESSIQEVEIYQMKV